MKAKHPPLPDDPCYGQYMLDAHTNYFFDEDQALIKLLQENVCCFGSVWHPDKDECLGIGVFVNCNDLFYWACADAEVVQMSEVEDLYRHDIADPKWGVSVWACKHRGQQPQTPVKERMIKDGVWTEELEKLKTDRDDDENTK